MVGGRDSNSQCKAESGNQKKTFRPVILSAVATSRSEAAMESKDPYDLIEPKPSVFQQLPSNYQTLYLAGPFANSTQLHITVKLFRRIILDKSIPAVDLHPFVGAPDRHFAGIQFRHGRFQRSFRTRVFHR